MIVGQVDHPRLDEGLLTREVILDPCAGLGHGLRDLGRLPLLSVDETTDRPLDVVVTQCLLFTDEQNEFGRQLLSSLDGQSQGFHDVIQMNERLAMRDVTRKDPTGQSALVNALDLVGEWNGMAAIGIDASDAEDGRRNVAPLRANHILRRTFDFG